MLDLLLCIHKATIIVWWSKALTFAFDGTDDICLNSFAGILDGKLT